MHPTELLLGYPYLKTKSWLAKSEYYSKERHLRYQRKTLASLLKFAATEIPFYRETVGNIAREISEDNSIELLEQFPYSSKAFVRENINRLSKPRSLRRLKATTGGSTASPMPFYMDRFVTRQTEKAFMWDLWSRTGYKPVARIASFTGKVPKDGKVFAHDRLFNIFVFSSFDLIKEKIGTIIFALNYLKPEFLHGYPSTLTSLAKLLQKSNSEISFKIKAVFCGSEKIYFHQRKIIEEVFDTKVISWYGHAEYCAFGGECEYSKSYHLYPQYGYLEFLEIENALHESGEKLYEIVATGFNNRIMPFIRYRTADYAILGDSTCECARHYPLVQEVVGRAQEFILDSKENLISVTALTTMYEKLPFIDDVQIIQTTPGILIFLIMPSYEPSKAELDRLIYEIETATQNRLKLQVQLTNEIKKTSNMKRRIVDQKIDLSSYLN